MTVPLADGAGSFKVLAFFVRFVSNDKAMDPKIALTILPFALAKFVSARNRCERSSAHEDCPAT